MAAGPLRKSGTLSVKRTVIFFAPFPAGRLSTRRGQDRFRSHRIRKDEETMKKHLPAAREAPLLTDAVPHRKEAASSGRPPFCIQKRPQSAAAFFMVFYFTSRHMVKLVKPHHTRPAPMAYTKTFAAKTGISASASPSTTCTAAARRKRCGLFTVSLARK